MGYICLGDYGPNKASNILYSLVVGWNAPSTHAVLYYNVTTPAKKNPPTYKYPDVVHCEQWSQMQLIRWVERRGIKMVEGIALWSIFTNFFVTLYLFIFSLLFSSCESFSFLKGLTRRKQKKQKHEGSLWEKHWLDLEQHTLSVIYLQASMGEMKYISKQRKKGVKRLHSQRWKEIIASSNSSHESWWSYSFVYSQSQSSQTLSPLQSHKT